MGGAETFKHLPKRCAPRAAIMAERGSRSEVEAAQSPQASGIKVLETLKKHVFEHGDSQR